jgi:chromosome segregation ATPase
VIPRTIDDLEAAVNRLLDALVREREKNRELRIRMAEMEAKLGREPEALDALREENRRLKRNTHVAAEKIEELLNRL